jgi:hypothetical protein
MDKLPTLTPESLAAFMKQLHDDAALKLDVVTSLGENGLLPTLERHFRLSEQQRKLLTNLQAHKGTAQVWEQIISGVLMAGGDVRLVESATESVHGEGHIHVGSNGFSAGASVEC